MAFTIPNRDDVADALRHQSRPDLGDFRVLADGHQRIGVRTGCAVTATGSGLQVAVAAGEVSVGISGPVVAVTAGNLTPDAAPTANGEARIDLVVVDIDDGTKSIVKGTAVVVTNTTGPEWPPIATDKVVLARLDLTEDLATMDADHIVDKRIFCAPSKPPLQYLSGNRAGGANKIQTIPDATWVPIHWGQVFDDSTDSTVLEGTDVETITLAVSLTGSGDTIEVADASVFATPTATEFQWLVALDVSAGKYQVVRYTGISLGTGTSGNDQITGVSLGSISLGTSDNVRQARVEMWDRDDPHGLGDWYLCNSVGCFCFVAANTGWRRSKMKNYANFVGVGVLQSDVYFGTDVPGDSGAPSPGQFVQCVGQPGQADTSGANEDPSINTLEVYQNSGGDLDLVRTGLPAAPIVMNAWFNTEES